jgi:hypothetical protein
VAARRHRRCPARARYAYREAVYPSPFDFSTGSSIRLDIEGRRDHFDTLADLDRSAMRAEQRARPGILVQQTSHRESDRLGLVAAGQLLGRLSISAMTSGRVMVTTFGIYASPSSLMT